MPCDINFSIGTAQTIICYPMKRSIYTAPLHDIKRLRDTQDLDGTDDTEERLGKALSNIKKKSKQCVAYRSTVPCCLDVEESISSS